MDREKAIKYLTRKGKLDLENQKFDKEEEEEIQEVMKSGKIYGDPIVNLKY